MNVKDMKDLNEKFVRGKIINGEFLNDNDLETLLRFYEEITILSDYLDSDFRLFRKELYNRLEVLKGYKESRKSS
jgi:hypothetical protein